MKIYSHDYTKVAEAAELLYSALRLIANDCIDAAKERVTEARENLLQYLNQDNMFEDPDCEGWIKASEAMDACEDIINGWIKASEAMDACEDIIIKTIERTLKNPINHD